MKNITVSVDDDLYHAARLEAAKQRKSLSALVREFLAGLQTSSSQGAAAGEVLDPEIQSLYAISDSINYGLGGSD